MHSYQNNNFKTFQKQKFPNSQIPILTYKIKQDYKPLQGHCGSDDKDQAPMQENQGRSLGWEDPLEKEMASHSSILTQGIPWTEGPGEVQSVESQRVGHNGATKTHPSTCSVQVNLIQGSPWINSG